MLAGAVIACLNKHCSRVSPNGSLLMEQANMTIYACMIMISWREVQFQLDHAKADAE